MQFTSLVRTLLAALVALLAWFVIDLLSAPTSALAASPMAVASSAGSDDSLLGGALGTVEPALDAVAVVPAVEPTVKAVVAAVVEPVVEPVMAPVVDVVA